MRTAVVAIVLVGVIALGAVAPAAAAPEKASSGEIPDVERLLIVSVPDLTWQNLEHVDLPNLNRLLDESALAGLTPRSVLRNSRAGDAYVTLGAGSRSIGDPPSDGLAFDRDETYGAEPVAEVYARRTGRRSDAPVLGLALPTIESKNASIRYDPEVGALGDALDDGGVQRAVVANADFPLDNGELEYGRQAALALMGADGALPAGRVGTSLRVGDPGAPYATRLDDEAVLAAFGDAWDAPEGVTLVELSDILRAGAYASYATDEQANALRDESLRRTDELLGRMLEDVDADQDAVLLVAPFLAEGRARSLTVTALRAPGVEPGLLRSATTRRTGFVTLVDVAPTVLDLVDVDQPGSMEGRPYELGDTDLTGDARRAFLVRSDAEAVFRDDLVAPVALAIIAVQAALAAGCLAALYRSRIGGRTRALLEWLALASLAFFPATHLAGLFRFDVVGAGVYWLFVFGTALVLGGFARLTLRFGTLVPLMVVLSMIYGLLLVDVLLEAPLQFNTTLGYSPTAAFRFAGYGNLAFAQLAAAAVLLAALAVQRWGRPAGLLVALVLLVVALLADGLPMLGSDVGGVLAATPTFGITALLLWGRRLRGWVLAGVVGVTLTAIGGFALVDLLGPSGERTHLGRLIEQTGDTGGGAFFTVVGRKADASLSTITTSVWTLIVPVIVAFIAVLALTPPRRLGALVDRYPALGPGLVGGVLAAVLGTVLNDSGIAVFGVVAAIFNGSLVFLALRST